MFGILLTGISAVFDEIAFSIGKKKISDGLESYYTFGFLTQILSALCITAIGFIFTDLNFSLAALPTFVPRVLVAILMLQLAVIAVAKLEARRRRVPPADSAASGSCVSSEILASSRSLTAECRGRGPR